MVASPRKQCFQLVIGAPKAFAEIGGALGAQMGAAKATGFLIFTAFTFFFLSAPASAREFGGFECTDDCSGHAAGYRWAEEHTIDDETTCPMSSSSFHEGCVAYVQDPSHGAEENDEGNPIDWRRTIGMADAISDLKSAARAEILTEEALRYKRTAWVSAS